MGKGHWAFPREVFNEGLGLGVVRLMRIGGLVGYVFGVKNVVMSDPFDTYLTGG